jgi:hypothetical protein
MFFGLVATPLWAALVWPWPGLGRAYAKVFQPLGEVACAFVFAGHQIDLVPNVRPGTDTEIVIRRDGHPGIYRVGFDSWSTGYLPFATFLALLIALILTTRSLPRRRWRSFLIGALLVHLYVGLHLLVLVLDGQARFAEQAPEAFPAFIGSGAWRGLMARAKSILHDNHVAYSLTPVVIWGLACFEGRDLGLLRKEPEEPDSSRPTEAT